MRSTNVVFLVGIVGADPRTGTTKAGNNWANCSLATHRMKKDNTQVTTWHRITAWGKLADTLAELRKGDLVFVEGELENNSYTNKQGQKVDTIQVSARAILKGVKSQSEPSTDVGFGGSEAGGNEYQEQGGF